MVPEMSDHHKGYTAHEHHVKDYLHYYNSEIMK